MNDIKNHPCVFCFYARMRRDICGIYCSGSFLVKDGTCSHFVDWEDHKKAVRRERKQNGDVSKQSIH